MREWLGIGRTKRYYWRRRLQQRRPQHWHLRAGLSWRLPERLWLQGRPPSRARLGVGGDGRDRSCGASRWLARCALGTAARPGQSNGSARGRAGGLEHIYSLAATWELWVRARQGVWWRVVARLCPLVFLLSFLVCSLGGLASRHSSTSRLQVQ